MPRLVSLTLLSVLALPAAALAYIITIMIGYGLYGWRRESLVWLTANAVTFAGIVAWWLLLWAPRVRWTTKRIRLTLAMTCASVAFGFFVGLLTTAVARVGDGFDQFVGGVSCMIAWLVAACVIWRDRAGIGTALDAGTSANEPPAVTCPKCGYALNGLREARCPECGEAYTLDALLLAQPALRRLGDLDRAGQRAEQ